MWGNATRSKKLRNPVDKICWRNNVEQDLRKIYILPDIHFYQIERYQGADNALFLNDGSIFIQGYKAGTNL